MPNSYAFFRLLAGARTRWRLTLYRTFSYSVAYISTNIVTMLQADSFDIRHQGKDIELLPHIVLEKDVAEHSINRTGDGPLQRLTSMRVALVSDSQRLSCATQLCLRMHGSGLRMYLGLS